MDPVTSEMPLRSPEIVAEVVPVLSVDLTPADCQALTQALARTIRDLTVYGNPDAPFVLDEEIEEEISAAWVLIERLSIPVRDWPDKNPTE